MTDIKKLSDAFDEYMLRFGFQPLGEDIRGNLCWRDEDALPILEALQLTARDSEGEQHSATH